MSLLDQTLQRIEVDTLFRWCTDATVSRNNTDFAAYDMVQILKGNPFKGYFRFNTGSSVVTINANNASTCQNFLMKMCSDHLARRIGDRHVTIAPIPNSTATPSNLNFRTLELAASIARRLEHNADARPLLAWKVPQKKASKGERSRNWRQHVDNLVVSRSTNRPVVLFDDVLTTGSQMFAAKQVLEKAGFKVLGAIAVASVLEKDGATHSSEPEWLAETRSFFI